PVLFAGPRAGAQLVDDAALGRAVEFDAEAVATAMRELLVEAADGTTERERGRRAGWARQNVSLGAVAERAATAVSQALETGARKIRTTSRGASRGGERRAS